MFCLCRNETIAVFWTRVLLEVLRLPGGCHSDNNRFDYYTAYGDIMMPHGIISMNIII